MRWYWIDRFLEFERGKRAVAIKAVTMSEEQHDSYLPGYPVLPSSLMIEGMAQTAGILVGEMSGFEERVVLAKINKAVFHAPTECGDTLRYNAVLQDVQKDGAIASVTAHVGDELRAEVDMMFAFLDDRFPKGPLFDPEDFLVMLRSFHLYDVGIDEHGQPIKPPESYLQAESAAYKAAGLI
ncbi:3-hydroxyacyl-[acyl-carrier-protein] dehydratase FabZ [Anatilimnocola aggregata]|uniref:3-hydroxyacyl-[acyl-carrier-protein] dehydratase FabZ n=1 Tax=Anatilimnocola aggregata TaxID=2528021 RepID=A0A517YJI0_9BACT|nr:3-hydroxyacyl-ACP dehydratase FabZ family protein [Anatilimnocola aggregata]QDU30378.1 3-hydroxyacyl-[acyl-carrier-protein] dehydratase FabZ [Anatilimnocola aggregata]